MEKRNKRSLIVLGILLLIFIFTFVRALKPTKKVTITIPQSGSREIFNVEDNALVYSSEPFNFEEVDQLLNRVHILMKDIEQKQEESFDLKLSKDPFFQPDTKYTEKKTEISTSIIVPDFRISGIVYDKENPMVVIDDEVKAENETKSGYTISKILPDRVVLKYKDKTFELYVDSNNKDIVGRNILQISDADDVSDTLVFSSVKKNYRSILKDNEGFSAESFPRKNIQLESSPVDVNKSNFGNKTDEKIITVQVASFDKDREKNAIKLAEKLSSDGFVDVRVEKINGLYAIRVGRAGDIDDLVGLCEQLKKYSESSFIRKAFYIEKRIIFPRQDNG